MYIFSRIGHWVIALLSLYFFGLSLYQWNDNPAYTTIISIIVIIYTKFVIINFMNFMNFFKNLTYNKISVIITLASESCSRKQQ